MGPRHRRSPVFKIAGSGTLSYRLIDASRWRVPSSVVLHPSSLEAWHVNQASVPLARLEIDAWVRAQSGHAVSSRLAGEGSRHADDGVEPGLKRVGLRLGDACPLRSERSAGSPECAASDRTTPSRHERTSKHQTHPDRGASILVDPWRRPLATPLADANVGCQWRHSAGHSA
jgi:hypothetical protein